METITYADPIPASLDVGQETSNMDVMNELAEMNVRETAPPLGEGDRGFVYAVARRIVGSANDADDVTQDAMILAYRYRDSFRGEAKYRTWLYRIAATTAIGFLRKRKRSREQLAVDPDQVGAWLADDTKPVDAVLAEADTEELVQRAIAALDPKYRDVLLCRVDATESETAEKLGISVANVKIRAHRARKQLRSTLEAVR